MRIPRILALLALLAPLAARADDPGDARPPGRVVAEKLNARDEGESVVRTLTMELVDRRGKQRTRVTRSYRRYYPGEKRTVLFYTSPKNVKDTGFLTYDYDDPDKSDDQWLYLPAMRKVRRISASDRGDYFLGTDLTYEDMKKENKVSLDDYAWTNVGEASVDGHHCWVLEGVPVSDHIAKELGYSKVRIMVDSEIWMPRTAEYWDRQGNALKTTRVTDIREVQGIWTAHRIDVENHKTGHSTVLLFSDVDYRADISDDVFTERSLRRGGP